MNAFLCKHLKKIQSSICGTLLIRNNELEEMRMEQIKSAEKFQEVIGQDGRNVVIFTTTWCPDCKRLDMFIDGIVVDNKDKNWYVIDKDEFPEIAEEQNVRGIPSLLVYNKGEKLAHLHSANAKTEDQVREFIQQLP